MKQDTTAIFEVVAIEAEKKADVMKEKASEAKLKMEKANKTMVLMVESNQVLADPEQPLSVNSVWQAINLRTSFNYYSLCSFL